MTVVKAEETNEMYMIKDDKERIVRISYNKEKAQEEIDRINKQKRNEN